MSGIAGMKIPGVGGGGTAMTRLGATPTAIPQAALPDIYVAEPGDAMPSICLVGASGAGKTYQLGRLIAHLQSRGMATIVLSVESKHQGLAHLRPLILPIGAPIKTSDGVRVPTPTEKYHRLIRFRDELREGRFRSHDGRPIGALVTDGLTEMGNVVRAHRLANMPTTTTSGKDDGFRAWRQIGEDLLDLFASFKEAASDAGKALGMTPLAIVATCVETLKDGKFQTLLPGNIAVDNMAQQFEVVLRLAVEPVQPGMSTEMQYVAHLAPGEVMLPQMGRWDAKAPSGLFDSTKLVNPDLGLIYEKLVARYKGEATGA